MRSLIETLPAVLELAVVGLGSVARSVAGPFIERFALASARSGRAVLAGWTASGHSRS